MHELDSDRLIRENEKIIHIEATKKDGVWVIHGSFSKEDIHDLVVNLLEMVADNEYYEKILEKGIKEIERRDKE